VLQKRFDAIQPLSFDSNFESGNLANAVRVGPTEYELTLRDDDVHGYNLWFYFKVTGMKPGTSYTMRIINYHKSVSLYRCGQKPLIHSSALAVSQGIGWHRWETGGVRFTRNKGAKAYTVSLEGYRFPEVRTGSLPPDGDIVHIAYLYPYTLTQMEQDLSACQAGPGGYRVKRDKLEYARCACALAPASASACLSSSLAAAAATGVGVGCGGAGATSAASAVAPSHFFLIFWCTSVSPASKADPSTYSR
jgi:hypothetical protein